MALSDPIIPSPRHLIPGLHHHCTGCQDEPLDWQSAILIIFCCLEHLLFPIGAQLLSMCYLPEHIFIPQIQILHSTTNCRLNTDGLENIFTVSNWSTTTSKVVITFSPAPIVATTASQTDLLGQFHKMWSRLSAVECCHILWKWSFD